MEFKCIICLESCSVNNGIVRCSFFNNNEDSETTHETCAECIKRLARSAITNASIAKGGIGLLCPFLECNNILFVNDFDAFLDENTSFALARRLQDEAIFAAELEDLVTCSGCGTKFCVDPDLNFFDCQCGRRQCRTCPRIYDENHMGVPCSEFDEQDRQDRLEPKLSEIAIRVCHKCKVSFVKEEGCNKMVCRCGAKQCYLCRQAVEDYSHFCECGWKETSGKCPRCHKSCPLFGNPEERDRIQMEEVIVAFNKTENSTISTNLFIKNFGDELDHEDLFDLFENFGEITNYAVMKHPDGKAKGFGFVAFVDSKAAEAAIKAMNGYVLPISKNKLYVAQAQIKAERQAVLDKSVNLYIKNLNSSVTNDDLLRYFEPFGKIISAKVMCNENGQSKGFGFVCFSDSKAAETVIKNLNDRQLPISKTKIYIGIAQKKSKRQAQLVQGIKNNENNTLYVKNLDKSIDENCLREEFGRIGKVVNAKIMYDGTGVSRGFGFVSYENSDHVARAIRVMNNRMIRRKPIVVRLYRRKEGKLSNTSNTNAMNRFNPADIPGPSGISQPRVLPSQRPIPLPRSLLTTNPNHMVSRPSENQRPQSNVNPSPPQNHITLLQTMNVSGISAESFSFLLKKE